MNAHTVMVLVSTLAVAGCTDPARYSTPALDPAELAVSGPERSPEAPQADPTSAGAGSR